METTLPSSLEGSSSPNQLVRVPDRSLPPLELGKDSPRALRELDSFYHSVASVFEAWVKRRKNPKTRATYKNHVLQFAAWAQVRFPQGAEDLLRVSVHDVQRHRDELLAGGASHKTVNGRLSALSSFFEFLRAVAAEYRLPVNLPNPAHRDWNPRLKDKPKKLTRDLTLAQMHELLTLPKGEDVIAYRDRARLSFLVGMGARISTACALKISDFFENSEQGPQVKLWEKGGEERIEGCHIKVSLALRRYLEVAGLTSGPVFRPRLNARSKRLAEEPMSVRTMARVVQEYLDRLPGGTVRERGKDGTERLVPLFHPHCLRATAATVLHETGVHPDKIQRLLGHKKPETTQGYNRHRYKPKESASHAMPL